MSSMAHTPLIASPKEDPLGRSKCSKCEIGPRSIGWVILVTGPNATIRWVNRGFSLTQERGNLKSSNSDTN